jgi:hypothetical protein
MKTIITLAFIALCLSGCDTGSPPVPGDTLIDGGRFVIYHKKQRNDLSLGKWEYYVSDGSAFGFRFFTDSDYKVGDRLKFEKEE